MRGETITVVIPARDEARSIGAVIHAVREALAGDLFEILVVDDGSADATARRAQEAGARLLRLPGVGYGAAIKAGAREAAGSILAILDADGTYPESALPALVAAVRGGARQAIGARPAWSGNESPARSAAKRLFCGAVLLLGGIRVPDLNSGMRVLRRRDLLALEPLLPDRFSLTTTLTLALASEGDPAVFLPIEYRPRSGRSKWRPLLDTWLMARTVSRGIGWLRQGRAPLALPVAEVSR